MLNLLALIMLGFVVGLSGAVIPGPLLAFVIFDVVRKHRVTGHLVIVGHALWEALIICLILFGLGSLIMRFRDIIYMAGGAMLILMGVLMVKGGHEVKIESSKVNSSLLGGIFYTAFNPSQPPWWASAGLALLLQGYEVAGNLGIATVTFGHWLADLTYYTMISYIIFKYGRLLTPRQRQISLTLAVFVIVLGAYFIINGTIR